MKQTKEQLIYLNPIEADICRILIQNHLNSVSEIVRWNDIRIGKYLALLEKLESKLS